MKVFEISKNGICELYSGFENNSEIKGFIKELLISESGDHFTINVISMSRTEFERTPECDWEEINEK